MLTLLGKCGHSVEDVDGIDQAIIADAALHAQYLMKSTKALK